MTNSKEPVGTGKWSAEHTWSGSINILDGEGQIVAHVNKTCGSELGMEEFQKRMASYKAIGDLIAAAPELLEALKKASQELNEIRARDGVPFTHQGWKASVAEEYFSSVVDECFSAIAKAEGRTA